MSKPATSNDALSSSSDVISQTPAAGDKPRGPADWEECKRKLFDLWSSQWGISMQNVGVRLKPQQLDSIRYLLDKKDVNLIAKTGFGKSLIFHSLPLLRGKGSVAIIVLPCLYSRTPSVLKGPK